MKTQQFNILNSQSAIEWIGKKVTGAHNGTIALKEGFLIFQDDVLTQGRFIINMDSLVISDITDPVTNKQFAAHLASDDFFNIEEYPEAWFEVINATLHGEGNYTITGSLTIKGITKTISFNANVLNDGIRVKAIARIVVDRTEFGIKFRSGNFFTDLGDTLIYNDFFLDTEIHAELESHPALAVHDSNKNNGYALH